MGCLVGLFAVPYRFLKWCFTNGTKGFIILGVVVLVLLIAFLAIQCSINKSMKGPDKQQTTQLNLPDRYAAPWMVETTTRTYYAAKAVKNKKTGDVTMTTYWELSGKKWMKNPGTLVLDAASYGKNIIVTKRR